MSRLDWTPRRVTPEPPKLPTVTERARRFYAARQAQLRAERARRAARPS